MLARWHRLEDAFIDLNPRVCAPTSVGFPSTAENEDGPMTAALEKRGKRDSLR